MPPTGTEPITIASPNLSMDHTMVVDRTVVGMIHRSITADVRGGGKGANVARALRVLGVGATVVGVASGRTGEAVVSMLADEGIPTSIVEGSGETRTCLTVLGGDSTTTVFNGSGPPMDPPTWTRYRDLVLETARGARILICSGSWPPGAPEDAIAHLVSGARAAGIFTIVDTSRAQLARALEAEPDLIKPNLSEAMHLLSGGLDEPVDEGPSTLDRAREAALRLAKRGPRAVVVSAGSGGAVLVGARGEIHAFRPPAVDVLNPVGAGDSLVAGIAAALLDGVPLERAVIRGIAAGAASCETLAAGVIEPDRVEELASGVTQAD